MTIVSRPSSVPSLLGGSIELPVHACGHEPGDRGLAVGRRAGTSGRVAVVGAGKMGLPLAAQFASHGWRVTAVDVQQSVVDSINAGESHVGEEPGLAGAGPGRARRRAPARRRPTALRLPREADVVVLIVPVMLDDEQRPDYRYMDAAVESIGPGIHAGSVVIFETTLPVGDTRGRFAPRLEAISGPSRRRRLLRRLLAGAAVQRRGAPQPRDLPEARRRDRPGLDRPGGGLLRRGPRRRDRGDVERRGGRVQQARRHDLPRREHRPRQRVRPLRGAGRRRHPRGHRRGQQPAVLAHPPARASASAGTASRSIRTSCWPARRSSRWWRPARRTNDGQVGVAIKALQQELGGLDGVPILVLGLTYRHGVKELAYSRALPLIERLTHQGAVVSAYDPLLTEAETLACCATAWTWGSPGTVPGDRDPDRRPAVRDARPGLVPGPCGRLRRAGRAARPGAAGGRGPTRDRRAGRGDRPVPAVGLTCGWSASSGRVRSSSRRAALLPAIRARHDEVFVDTGQHWDEAMAGLVLRGARAASAGPLARDRRRWPGGADRADARRPSSRSSSTSGRTRSSSTATRTRRWPARSRRRRSPSRWPTSRPASARSTGRCPRRSTGSSPTTCPRWLFAPTPTAVANLAAEGVTDGVSLVGDVLQDLAARTAAEVADPAVLPGSRRRSVATLRASTSPRAVPARDGPSGGEPRRRRRCAAGRTLLGAVARPERPVILPLHPGTAARWRRPGSARPRTSGSCRRSATGPRWRRSSTRPRS